MHAPKKARMRIRTLNSLAHWIAGFDPEALKPELVLKYVKATKDQVRVPSTL
jgi:hypothetical protein